MDKNSKISIIIPVYNVEKHIEKCLMSLLDQTHQNFEAILVDDGSLDGSIKIAKKISGDDSRFIFLAKENGGQASARNIGLNFATGSYISFLDSDDHFKNDFLEKMLKPFSQDLTIDIVVCGYEQIDEDDVVIQKFMPNVDKFYDSDDILLAHENIDYNVWNKVYKRTVWDKEPFIEGIIFEDKEILPRIFYKKKVYLVREYLCYYLLRNGSTMNSYNRAKSVSSILYIYQEYYNFLISKNIYGDYKDYYNKAYIKFVFFRQLYLMISFSNNYNADCRYLMRQLDNKIVTLTNIKRYYGLVSKQFITFMLFKASPYIVKFCFKAQRIIKDMFK